MAENRIVSRLRSPGLAACCLLAAIVMGYYWKLLLTDQYTWLSGDDTASQVLPWFQFQAGEWHQGRFPLWDPSHWAGQPLPGQAQPGTMYPPNWLLFSLPLRDGWMKQAWLHGYFVLIHLAAAWFAYLLARTVGATRAGAILGGIVFTLSGWMGQTEWPQMLNSAIWAPLTALFLLKWLESSEWRHAAFAGFFLGVAWLGGHHQIPIFVATACLVFSAWALWRNWRAWPSLLVFWTTAAFAGAAQILPALEYGRLAVRWVNAPLPVGWQDRIPYTLHIVWSTSPVELLGFLFPFASTHTNPFLGFTCLSLATLGVIWNWHRRAIRLLALLFLLGCSLAMVHYTPVHGLFYALVPMVEKARNPTTALFLCGLAAAPLAALGLSGITQRADSIWYRRFMLAGLFLGGLLFAARAILIQFRGFPGVGEQRELAVAAAALACAALLAAYRARQIGPIALQASLVFLALVEFTSHAGTFYPNVKTETDRTVKLRAMGSQGDIAAWLRKQPGLFRVEADDKLVPYNFGDWHGLQQSGGYLASVTEKIYLQGLHKPATKNLLGVAFRIAAEPDSQFPELVFTSASGLKIWKNPDAMPRAFVQYAAGGSPACQAGDSVRAAAYHPGFIRIAAQLSCAGTLVFSENNYPGWRVTVDGRPAPLIETQGFLLGTALSPGAHWVEFAYRPASVYLGGALSLAALLAILAMLLSRR